jgi:hypothetical protein
MEKVSVIFAIFALLTSIIVTIPSERTFAQNETETYENDEFGFAFEHPSNWKETS